LLGEYDGAGKAIQETVYLGDLPVAVLKPSTNGSRSPPNRLGINYVYADHLSTPRVLTRASDNKMVWRWDNADPFGVDQPDQNPGRLGELTYNPRFPGQVFDKETNNITTTTGITIRRPGSMCSRTQSALMVGSILTDT
jgi:uncharacterized protein RhaS with RHS repeats